MDVIRSNMFTSLGPASWAPSSFPVAAASPSFSSSM